MVGRSAQIALVLTAAAAGRARADKPVTSTNYAIELYDNGAIGNDATIAMGGAAVANASGSSGTLINPSAPAVRATTDTDHWSWDYHLDYLNSSLSNDYANSGHVSSDDSGKSVFTLGLAIRVGDWGVALTGTTQGTHIDDPTMPLTADTLHTKLAVARWVPRWDLAIGVAAQFAQFDLDAECAGCKALFSIEGGGLEGGATWIPREQSFRLGAELATPIAGGKVVASTCPDPMNCQGYILPDEIVTAWHVAAGGAYRWAPTAWNQMVHKPWRDESALTAVADVVIVGSTTGAYGLDAFAKHELQRSGEHAAYSMRAGAEYEWLPGRLRLRAGSYWEPGRFEGVGGRLHGTFGVEVRAFEFDLYGPRRGQLTLTADLASQYRNGGLSIGFWH